MGVTGLWRLVEPAGQAVPVETLENKVLAVDISIWLHQMVKGYQDAKGAPLPNAHLMGLFQRLCKLLYFRIKPVFVFDGAFPALKKETIAKRQDHKAKYNSESERIKRELALLLSKQTAVNSLLGRQISPKQSTSNTSHHDDIFKLPPLPQNEEESESESEDKTSSGSIVDLHSMDIESDNFKNMSAKEKYDLLIELKETRKMNSWGKLHELPKKSDSFSDFQMQRLLKRRKVQECLEETEKEMGDSGMSLNELESLLNEEGIDTKIDTLPTRRIASNENTRFLLIKDVKQALADAKKRKEVESKPVCEIKETENAKPNDELENDLQKAIKMSLECEDEHNVSGNKSKTDDSWTSCMTDSEDAYSYDSEEDDGFQQPDNLSTAKAYIMQYSDFTHSAINKLVTKTRPNKNKNKVPKVDQILEEINNEKSVIVDNVELSSGDEDCIKDSQSSIINSQNTAKLNSTSEDSDLESKNNPNATQVSVVCVENQQNIISLDTSTEEIANEMEDMPKNIIKQEYDSSDVEFEEVYTAEVTTQELYSETPNTDTKNESDSSDNEFEDVPEIDKANKPIVQLTLNMGDAPDDDIFADIFQENKETLTSEIRVNQDTKEINANKKRETPPIESKNNAVIEDTKTKDIYNKHEDTEAIHSNKGPIVNAVTETLKNNTNEKVNIIKKNLPAENTKNVSKENIDKQSEVVEVVSNITTVVTNPPKEVFNTEKLTVLAEEMQNEEQGLLQEKGRLDRIGRNITQQMTKEAQELLQIFGIPYVVAPMEAEAQCAFLENAKLTDGTITDDSDIWLFGGRTVYKNFFNQKKHVLQFLADRIEKSFNLNREQLVLLALLVGSDYTTGLTGVGPVTALEILASFPFNKKQLLNETSKQARYSQIVKGLEEFKQWVRAGKRTDNISLKKKLKNVNLTDDFPSVRVVHAYLEPNIEKSEEKFSWGELDITILRDYTKAKFGWSQNKLDKIINPVLKRIQDRKTQRSMKDFFKRKVEFQSLDDQMSKRVKAAVQRMGPEKLLGNETAEEGEKNKPARKRKTTKDKGSVIKNVAEAGPSSKLIKGDEGSVLNKHGVKVVSQIKDGKTEFEIKIPKSDRVQEIIPQREKEKQSLLQNKMKAIEVFRKTNIDTRKKSFKRKAIQPKDKADLSESDSD